MSKKKIKKKKIKDVKFERPVPKNERGLLANIDKNIVEQYLALEQDISDYQYQLYLADKKTKKKYKKYQKKGKLFYISDSPSVKKKMEIIKSMEENNFLEVCIKAFNDMRPILKLLGRTVALLLTALLSIDAIKRSIKPETMSMIDTIFNLSMAL